jgi:hypothetical protein
VTKPIAQVHDTVKPCLQPSPPQLEPRFAPRNSSLPRVFFYLEWLLVFIAAVPQRSIFHCRLLSVPSAQGGNQGRVHTISILHVGHVGCCASPLCILAFLANPAPIKIRNLRAVPTVPLIFRNIAFHQESARPLFVAILHQTNALLNTSCVTDTLGSIRPS